MSAASAPGKPSILFVVAARDDYDELLETLISLYNMTWANSLAAAIDLYSEGISENVTYDAILIEDALPDGSGFSFLQSMKEQKTQVAVALISGSDSIETAIHALRLNAYEFIRKPIVSNVVLEAISKGIRKTREIRLQAKREQAGDSAAQLAHDVASIVTIMSFHDPDDPIIQHSVQKIAELYSHFRKTQNGPLTLKNHHLPSLLAGIHADLLVWLRANQVQLVQVVFTEIPICHISVDRIYFVRVLENLLRNAVQAMERVTDRPKELHLSAKTEDGNVLISIRDTGLGMENELMERIFDAYFTTRSEGTGLGLHICRQFVKEMRGEITVDSVIGRGSTFTVSFPTV